MAKTPLYVRLPAAQAAKLDRAAFELRAPKQDLVAGLVARYVDPTTTEGLAELRDAVGFGRQSVATADEEGLTVGRHAFRPAETPEVLNPAQAAALLQIDEEVLDELAERGELPARRVGGEWRFARRALLDWLAGAE
jgi:excisionase family DNA binding protein